LLRLTAENLACDRGGRRVFHHLGFTLEAGRFTEVRGPNGAGKSSLLRLLAGLNEAAAGSVRVEGAGPEPELAQLAHYIAHQDAIKTALSVSENLAFWSRYFGGLPPAAALGVFDLTHLAHQPAGLLSAGQKRRLSLSRLALVQRPLWLLDEPSVGLDAASQDKLAALMKSHLDGGGLILATTHVPLGLKPDSVLEISGAREG
jgi:heme exporter protein A